MPAEPAIKMVKKTNKIRMPEKKKAVLQHSAASSRPRARHHGRPEVR